MKNIKKCLNLFILTLSILFIFSSCKPDLEPDICEVSLATCDGFKFELDKEYVIMGEFVRIKVIPEKSYQEYIFEGFNKPSIQDPEDSNAYFICVTSKSFYIIPKSTKASSYNIVIETSKYGSIELIDNKNYSYQSGCYYFYGKYKNEIIEFSVIPEKFYCIDKSLITVETYYKNIPVDFTQKEGEQNIYSFVMPDETVRIKAQFNIIPLPFSSLKDSYTQGENIILKMEDKELADELYNIYMKLPFEDDTIKIQSAINFNEPYVIDSTQIEPGPFTFIISSYTYVTEDLFQINGINNIPGTPDGWQTIGFKVEWRPFNNEKKFIFVTNYIDESITFSSITLKCFYEDNPSDIKTSKRYVYSNKHLSEMFLNESNYGTNEYITFWIEDEDKKIISKKVKVKIN